MREKPATPAQAMMVSKPASTRQPAALAEMAVAAAEMVVPAEMAVAVVAPVWSCSRACHNGTLPCFRRGSSSRLVDSIRRPATNLRRVSAGSITSST